MSDYIKREVIEEMLENAQLISDGEYSGYCTEDVNIDSLPSADVVERKTYQEKWSALATECMERERVVRCKDCVYHGMFYFDGKLYGCKKGVPNVNDVFYCSWGERKDNVL